MKKHSLPNGFLTAIKHYSDMVTKHGRDSKEARAAFQRSLAVTPICIAAIVHQSMIEPANDADFSAPNTN